MKMQVVKCPNCSGEVQIDETRDFGFCTYCGTKIVFSKEAPDNATEAFVANREAALEEINKLSQHFKPLSGYLERLSTVDKQLGILKRKNYNEFIVGGGILAFIGFAIASSASSISNIIIAMLFAGGGAALILRRIKKVEEKQVKLVELEDERNVLSGKIQNLHDTYTNCPVGPEYCKPEILDILHNYIQNGRAETIKEAINLLKTEEHNAEMKEIALETQAIAQENLRINKGNAKRRK